MRTFIFTLTRVEILQESLTGESLKAIVVLLESNEGSKLRAPGQPPGEVLREKLITQFSL